MNKVNILKKLLNLIKEMKLIMQIIEKQINQKQQVLQIFMNQNTTKKFMIIQ